MKTLNPYMKWLLCSRLHRVVSDTYLLLTVTGRKSGAAYTTPVQYKADGDKLYIVTSEGYTWWKNLRGGAEVQLRLRGTARRGHAVVATDAASVDALLRQVYPILSDAQRAAFVPGKVAVTVTLHPVVA
jgi:deazaflavin-dependent oxidoreductase (nitroreductase family)